MLGKENAPPHSLRNSKTEGQQASQNLVWGKKKAFLPFERQLDQPTIGRTSKKGGIQLSDHLVAFQEL